MKRLFISQPMRDKTDEEILAEREKAVKVTKKMLNEDLEVIDSYFQEAPHGANPLWYLAKSLELLATADVAFFCTGWEKYRGCRVEHTCANEYGIRIIRKMDTKENNTLTKSDVGDIKTHLLRAKVHYKKELYFWEQLVQREGVVSECFIYPKATKNIEALRELEQNVEQLLNKIKGLG